ncbi:TRAP transporter fused permease subunit [Tateyamaria sp. ANG-S1]|uniref:TRAP transporter permease n=1 Tax=Tateyamaria sp. ANG-S1 TaxID=1577905 RepID=UPI00057D6115|nr:TRAP transporter fused permease subunit [Tateyamaria sp. ANG-S1]KIC44956.1 C4-dicarboxylate ABC transporter permease [Tateyamaria sp. ANG-S1]
MTETATQPTPLEQPETPVGTDLLTRVGFLLCAVYAGWHLYVLNIAPLETWTFRIMHIAGALILGFGTSAALSMRPAADGSNGPFSHLMGGIALIGTTIGLGSLIAAMMLLEPGTPAPPPWTLAAFGPALAAGTLLAILTGWLYPARKGQLPLADIALIVATLASCGFILFSLDTLSLRLRAGTPFADPNNGWAAFVIIVMIAELTRRLAGLALVVIALVFIAYAFAGPWMPGFLEHRGYDAKRFFTYVFTDNGVLGPTTAVSSTYIILFIIFAAFLQSSKVGDYFVNFSFAAAGRAKGGPAKVSVLASGLMGMINGTSAGNVVSTGSLTIPLMKKVGYRPQSAAAIEAAASTGGQIMPPIMGAGAFIMAEITGIPYTELVVAALIPAILYFASIYFMVDFEASRTGMRGMRADELPKLGDLAKQAYLFLPIVILIGALFSGYSVIRAGTLAIASAAVVSWLTPYRMGPKQVYEALGNGGRMSLQIIIVCACAGLIVGVISLTGVGARFSSLLFDLAQQSTLLALIFAMMISVILGMGMPTTAAYAVAASVVAPGLIEIGIAPLISHFFVFYFAVVSAITPPVALAAYAGAAIAGSEPMRTSVTSFKVGLAAFIVPFMFFYSPGLLMEAPWYVSVQNLLTALIGVYMLAGAVQGWFIGTAGALIRIILLVGAVCMISGDWRTDLLGIAIAGLLTLRGMRTLQNST